MVYYRVYPELIDITQAVAAVDITVPILVAQVVQVEAETAAQRQVALDLVEP